MIGNGENFVFQAVPGNCDVRKCFRVGREVRGERDPNLEFSTNSLPAERFLTQCFSGFC